MGIPPFNHHFLRSNPNGESLRGCFVCRQEGSPLGTGTSDVAPEVRDYIFKRLLKP